LSSESPPEYSGPENKVLLRVKIHAIFKLLAFHRDQKCAFIMLSFNSFRAGCVKRRLEVIAERFEAVKVIEYGP